MSQRVQLTRQSRIENRFGRLGLWLWAALAVLLALPTHAAALTLATPYNSNNGQRGAMFDVAATNTVTIRTFDANLYVGTTANYEIYYRAGSHVGNETNAAAWTLIGTTTGLTSLGSDLPTPIPIPVDITIPAGQTYAFYVTNDFGGGTSYTDGTAVGNFLAGDANLTVFEGVGKSYPFGLTFSVRNFNGTLHYDLGGGAVSVVPAPTTVPAPGGTVTYKVTVTNFETGTLSLTGLSDSLLGSLDGVGSCAVPQTLAPSTSYSCSFTASVNGAAGSSVTRTVTAIGTSGGNNFSDSGVATVDIVGGLVGIALTKTASPTSITEPSGTVTFTVRIDNTGTQSADITALSDDIHGNLNGQGDCNVPQTLAIGGFYQCSFTATVTGGGGGSETDTVTASGVSGGLSVTGQDSATVTFTDLPSSIIVTKTATPSSVAEPSGAVSFTVRIDNTSAVDVVTITALTDDIHGNLAGQGSCAIPQVIAVGAFYQCAFPATVSGNAGTSETDTVTASGSDDDGNLVSAQGSATVTITDVLPAALVTKTASPTSVDEPGGNITFTVRVDNTGSAESLSLSDLNDDIHGDLNGQGDCAVPQTVAAGGFYQCSFTAAVNGNAGDSETDTVTATLADDDSNTITPSDSATVTITDVASSISVTKTASPTSVAEPGGTVTFTVRVDNTSTVDSVAISSLSDDIHGNLAGQGDCAVPQTVAAAGFYQCSFTAAVNGNAGDSETNTVTASGTDDDSNPVSAQDSATVTVTDVMPTASVTKTASPNTVDEPGGNVTFTVRVDNTGSAESLALSALDDDIHGDLNGQGDCAVPQTVAAGGFYQCSFTAAVNGNAGDSETDTVTATLSDDDGNSITPNDSATVTITGTDWGDAADPSYPTLLANDGARHTIVAGFFLGAGIDAEADGQPDATATGDDTDGNDDEDGVAFASVLVPGMSVGVDIIASAAGLLDAWIDFNGNGSWADTGEQVFTGQALTSGLNNLSISVPATATTGATGARFRLSSAGTPDPTGLAADGEVEDYQVAIEAPSISVTKTASPASLNEPGGSVTFTVRVDNTGTATVALSSLVDDVHGDLSGQGDCAMPQTIATGGFYQCSFATTVSGNAGFSETDTVTTTGISVALPVSAQDSETVTINDVAPTAAVTKTASPTSIDEPGGNITFTVRVDNTGSAESLALSDLNDDIHGDLNGQGDCAVPQTIAAGGFYQCSFTAAVNGNAGDSETDTVTATLADDDGNAITPSDSATVSITDVASSISVTKTASPTSVAEPGGTITFTVRVDNTSTIDSVTISSLSDDIHGNLAGQGDCAVPQTLAAGGFYQCSFTAAVNGNAGDSETDTVTASGTDDDSNPVSALGSATVTVTDVMPTASVTKTASPNTVDEPGGNVTFTVRVDNTGSAESLALSALDDDIHGDLNGQGDCTVPQTVAAGGFYQCSFTAAVNGNAGDSETDTVTATLSDDDGNSITPNDSATVTITGTDWGDAADPSYPTLLANDGARHTIVAGFFLGAGVDAEADGQPDATATGDDTDSNDDEDGVAFASVLVPGMSVGVDITASAAGLLDAWVDFNGNGSWTDAGEQVFSGQALTSGLNSLSISVPATATTGATGARFRLSSAGTSDPTGLAADGEVEDYQVVIEAPSISVTKTANPTSLNEPGGSVTFTVRVDNTGTASVALSSLVDDVHGDLNGQGDCAVPQTLATGGFYQCSFATTVSGNAGFLETDTVTATGTSVGLAVSAQDSATVNITDVLPTASVTKTASPTSVDEPGGNITFTVRVDNTGSAESLSLSALNDNIHGDLNGQGDCALPQTIAVGGFYQCSFTAAVNGNAGDSETDTVTAILADDDGNSITPSDSATVTITDVVSSITVTKTASPTTVAEPGGTITFTIRVDNTSTVDSVTISSLADDIHGNLAGQGDCAVPQTLAAGAFYQCSFTAAVNGNAGDSETDTVTASGTDDDSNPVSAQDSATVTVTDVMPTASVTKTASPNTVDEPGGNVTFTVRVDNTGSAESLALSALDDDIHGDLNGQGDCAVPQTVAAGGFYQCSFTAAVNGNAGDSETDTVTATLSDDDGNSITPNDSATVTITGTDWGDAADPSYPTLLANDGARHTIVAGFFLGAGVDAEADGQPDATATGDDTDGNDDEDGVAFASVLVPGMSVGVDITASAAGLLDAWVDFNGNGSWTDAGEQVFSGQALTSGLNSLSISVPGSATTGATVARFRLSSAGTSDPTGLAADGEVEDYQVVIEAPSISVSKTANPTSLNEPGGSVTFTVRVDNTGTASVALSSLVDDVHGDLNGQGDCAVPQALATGGFYQCSFATTVNGNAGFLETDTVTATGTSVGLAVSAENSATVTITDVLPTASVTKTASPTSVDEPGGNVTFTIRVDNTGSAESLALSALNDDIHGDLNGQGDCAVPQTLAAGGFYQCSFTAAVNGNAGDTQTDTVTATLSDDDGNTITPSDSATVTITDVASSISVTKTASPTSVAEPGGTVTFTIRVDNTSTVDSVAISSLSDDIHGNLAGQGDCAVSQTLAAAGFYQCSFTAAVNGNAGDSETNTVTASGTDDDSNPVSAQDSATVTVTDVLPTASVTKTANPTSIDEPGGNITFTVRVDNTGSAESLALSALDDDIHGDLNGQGDCAVPQTVAAGGFYQCSFTAAVNGNAGDSETDTVTATLSDDDGNSITPNDSATVTITGTDWGDAADPSYPTLLANDGARHTIVAGFFLGAGVDAEADGQPDATATGDDTDGNDDEDGVAFTSTLAPGITAMIEVTASQAGLLDAWIDFDGDGSWAGAGEQIFANEPLIGGLNNLAINVPGTLAARVVGRFRLSSSGGLSYDGLASDGEVEDYEIVVDDVPPRVELIGSTPDTGDGQLTYCETAQVVVSELRVVFNEAMRAGGGSAAADNPANYRLITPGADHTFDSSDCLALSGDDSQIPITGVVYQAGSPSAEQATARLQLAQPLVDNHYRLLACGTLADAVGNPLQGGDFSLDFRADALNLFHNGHFDCDLQGWWLDPPGTALLQHAAVDADDSADSGSMQVLQDGTAELAISQCIGVSGGAELRLGGRFRVDAPAQVQVGLIRGCEIFNQVSCNGAIVDSFFSIELFEDTAMSFTARESSVQVHGSGASAFCAFTFSSPDMEPVDLYVDRLFARATAQGPIFADGFETGNTAAWTAVAP